MAYDKSDKTGQGPDRNPDPITGAPGSHPTGVGIGAAAGGATGVGAAIAAGALTGSVAGPIGTAIGAIVGAVAGGYAGKAIGEAHDPTEDDTYWRDEHKNRPYYKSDYDYDRDLAPAYRYGSTVGKSLNDSYPDYSQRDVPTTTSSTTNLTGQTTGNRTGDTGTGVGDKISGAASTAGSKIADTGRSIKESVKDAFTSDDDNDYNFDRHDEHFRSNWDKVRGNSSLSYDQARDAIRDAYNRRIQLREEQLDVNKQRVQTGEATVRKEVVTEHRTVDVPVQREELVVERRPASGAASGSIGNDETIRVPLSEDRVNVSKRTVATEDVDIGTRSVTDTQKVEADVRKEKLNVDEAAKRKTDR